MSHKTVALLVLGLLVLTGGALLLSRQQAHPPAAAGAPVGSSAIGHGNAADAPPSPAPFVRP
jgi:hypothetical protein